MTATSQDIGPDLVTEARGGDPEALNTLVTRAYPIVRRWARVHTGDPAEADHLTQDVLRRVTRRLDAYQGDARFTTRLDAVTRHAAADRFRDAIGAGASRAIRVRRPSWHHAPVLLPRRSFGRVDPHLVGAVLARAGTAPDGGSGVAPSASAPRARRNLRPGWWAAAATAAASGLLLMTRDRMPEPRAPLSPGPLRLPRSSAQRPIRTWPYSRPTIPTSQCFGSSEEETMKKTTLALAILALLASGGGRQPQLETRTFAIHNLAGHEAEALIAPYVYTDRPDQPGVLSTGERPVTVRETSDKLAKIARVLEEFDIARPDMRLRFQVIDADGFTDTDPRIAAVAQELKKLFQFKGYRLAGEAVITVTDRGAIQHARRDRRQYSVQGAVFWAAGGIAELQGVEFWVGQREKVLQTSVSIRPGQTLVLGSTPKRGSTATLLLTVHAENVEG